MRFGPLRFRPIAKPRVWGGRRLEALLGRELPGSDPVGESWDLVDLPEGQSEVVGGPLAGATLHELVVRHPHEILGRAALARGRFPLLIKALDAHRMLSVQVHPDGEAVRRMGGAARPKTEAWFVVHADPGATLYAGVREGTTREAFAAALEEGKVEALLHRIAVAPGMALLLEAGTVHALGAGIVLIEVQQASDTTYRVHDWGRMGLDGRPRELHVEQALESIRFDRPPPAPARRGRVSCNAFVAAWRRDAGRSAEAPADVPRVLIATSDGALTDAQGRSEPLRAGDAVLLPAACGAVAVEGADYVRVELPAG